MNEEKLHRLERFEQALSNVCDLMQFERERQDTEDFDELMEDECYRRLVTMQIRYFYEIRKIQKEIAKVETGELYQIIDGRMKRI